MLGRTYRTLPTSPNCGPCCAPGLATRGSSPPTTPSSTGPFCTPVALGIGCARRGRGSHARFNSLGSSGESTLRVCPMSVAGCAFLCAITVREQTRWRARASCSRPRRPVGSEGGVGGAARLAATLARSSTCRWLRRASGGAETGRLGPDSNHPSGRGAPASYGRATMPFIAVPRPNLGLNCKLVQRPRSSLHEPGQEVGEPGRCPAGRWRPPYQSMR